MPPKHSPSEVTNRLSEHDDNVDGGVFASEPAFWFKSFHERLRSHSYGVEFIDVGAHDLTLEQECDYISFPAFALGTEKAAPHQLFTYVDKSFASKSKRSFTLVAGASVMLPALLEVHARLAQLEQQLEEQERQRRTAENALSRFSGELARLEAESNPPVRDLVPPDPEDTLLFS